MHINIPTKGIWLVWTYERDRGKNSIRATWENTLIPWWDALGNAMRMIWISWIQTSEDLRNFRRFALEFWDSGREEHGRERGGRWQLREVILERWGMKGYAEYDLEKFKVRNFRRKSETSAEYPKLPKKVWNFCRMFGTSEEMSGTSEVSKKFQQILILEILEIDLG